MKPLDEEQRQWVRTRLEEVAESAADNVVDDFCSDLVGFAATRYFQHFGPTDSHALQLVDIIYGALGAAEEAAAGKGE